MSLDSTQRASKLGISTNYANQGATTIRYLPQRIAVFAQGAESVTYTTDKVRYSSAGQVGAALGYGSPAHLIAEQLFPSNGDGVGTIPVTFYPLTKGDGALASTGAITPVGTQTTPATYYVLINKIRSKSFTIAPDASVATIVSSIVAAINGIPSMPVIASDGTTEVTLTSKYHGAIANDIYVEVEGSTTAGTTFTISQPAGGAGVADVSEHIPKMGSAWETLIINSLASTDTVTLGQFQTEGERRWQPTIHKPYVAFTGSTQATFATAIAVPDARTTDRINCQISAPGCKNLPFVVCARAVTRIAVQANNNPPVAYNGLKLTGLVPGLDSEQWSDVDMNTAVQSGTSISEVRDGIIELTDIVTNYHPSTDPDGSYSYVVDIIKLQNIIYNVNLIFESVGWKGAPLVPDGQEVKNKAARKPSMAKTALFVLFEKLSTEAIISEPEYSKATAAANISTDNPKRLDISFNVKLSGNIKIIDVIQNFGFYFGEVA